MQICNIGQIEDAPFFFAFREDKVAHQNRHFEVSGTDTEACLKRTHLFFLLVRIEQNRKRNLGRTFGAP